MSTKEDKFYINYNYLQLDKYLIEAEKIKNPIKKVDFWKDLLIKYEKDLNELKSENLTFETQIYLNPEYRYKKGSLLSADFKTLCKNQIEQIESFIDLKTRKDPATIKSVYNNLAEVWFFGFKQGNENKILNLENWETYKNEFYSFKISTYDDKYTLDEKKELERLKLAEIEAKDTDFDILKNRYLKYLNEVDDNPKTKLKTVSKIDDFFINTTPEQIELLKELISPLKGKELAMFISLAFNRFKILNLKSNSKDGFNQKTFIEIQGKTNQSVNKFLDRYFVFTGDTKDFETLEKQLNTILKDS